MAYKDHLSTKGNQHEKKTIGIIATDNHGIHLWLHRTVDHRHSHQHDYDIDNHSNFSHLLFHSLDDDDNIYSVFGNNDSTIDNH